MDWERIVERQAKLDSMIKGCRKRDMIDMHLSFRAEVIEYNETLGEAISHKTWKSKVFTREQQLDEYVDMIFFMAQMINERIEGDIFTFNRLWGDYDGSYSLYNTKTLIIGLMDSDFEKHYIVMVMLLKGIAINEGYSDDEIMEAHKKKYEYNLSRIGGEWN